MIRVGVVENNVDPTKIGRCQVRIFGLHTEDRSIYPTADLPWALLLTSSTNISGEGNFFIPNNGDFVLVAFLDPEEQKPVIIGVLPRFVEALPNFTSGFSDPNSVNPSSSYVGESGISRLARNEKIDSTIIKTKKDNRTTGVDCNGTSWDEPETPYNAVYPNNKVIHSKNHVVELDDSTGVERLHIYHKSGTSKEIHPNGDEVDLVKSKRYTVIDSDNNIYIKGSKNIRIDTNENKQVVGNEKKKVTGAVTTDITGNETKNIGGNKSETVSGNKTEAITSSSTENVGSKTISSGGSVSVSGTSISITGSGSVNITSSGPITLSGSVINLN